MDAKNIEDVQLKVLVQELLQEVQGLKQQLADVQIQVSDRLDDAEERLFDLSTEVRLQARRSSVVAATQLLLPLAGSNAGSAAASPRVAGPVSACATPRSNLATDSSRTAQQRAPPSNPSSSNGSKQEASSATRHSSNTSSSSGASKPCEKHLIAASAATAGAGLGSPAAAAANLGVFGLVKHWGADVLESPDELKKAAQLVAAAAASASEAQAAAARCLQQVLELRGRQGQAERRLDTLWQLQEAASQTEASVSRAQQELQQGQQQLQQQQQNLVAMRAQIQQLDCRCDASSAANSQLQRLLLELQQQADNLSRDAATDHDQLVITQAGLDSARAELQEAVQQVEQQLIQQLQQQREELAQCAGAAGGALDKCEQLRQGAVVVAGRLDAIPGQIQAVVQPLQNRLSAVEANLSCWSSTAAKLSSTVQQGQLNAALAQLSSSWTRQTHDLTSQLSCLTSRLELLEGQAAQQEQVVLQDNYQRQLAQLHSDVEVAVLHATAPLQKQLKGKADVSQLTSTSSSMEARLSSSEKSLLLGLKSVGDKAALLLQHKADLAAFEDWKQQVGEELHAVRAQLTAAQQAAAAAAVVVSHQGMRQLANSAAVHGSQTNSSQCDKGQVQRTAGALEVFAALMGAQADGSAAADTGDVAAAVQLPEVAAYGAVGIADVVNRSEAAPVLPALGHSTVTAAAAAAGSSSCSSSSMAGAGAALQHTDAQAASPSAAAASSTGISAGTTTSSSAGAAASSLAATIVRPLTTSKRHVSPARTQTPGNPTTTASSKRRPPSMQPWPSSASPAAAAHELHSAAHNAKLAKAARDKELARARLGDSRTLVAALVQSSAVPAAEEVADALQQQLNVLGLTSPRFSARAGSAGGGAGTAGGVLAVEGGVQQQEDAGCGKQVVAAAGRALGTALAATRAAAAATAVAAGSTGALDGSGRLVGTAGKAGLLSPIASPDRGDHFQAACWQLGGAFSACGVTYSLRLQSAGAQQHSKAVAASGVARTSSVRALPACTGSMPGASSAGGVIDAVRLSQQRQAPTAEGLRALLKGNSANGGSSRGGSAAAGSGQLPPAGGRISSGGSTNGEAKMEGEQDAVGAGVGRASPLALMKQQSGLRGSVSSSGSRITSA